MYAVSIFAARSASVPQMIFFRNLISLIIILPWMLKHGKTSFKTSRIGLILARSVTSILTPGLMFIAIQKTSLVDASLLSNSAPLFVPFIVALCFKKSINHRLWPALIIGFIGIAFILKPDVHSFDGGALFALAAGVCMAISTVAVRLTTTTEKIHTVLFYLFLIGALLMLPLTCFYWQTLNLKILLELTLMGILAALGQAAFVKACHYATATQLAPFGYSTVIFAGMIDFALWGKIPDWLSIVGILFVCAGGVLTILITRQKQLPFR